MSNELIRELVEALEYSSDFLSRSASRFDDVIETLAKARAYLETGGWLSMESAPKDRRILVLSSGDVQYTAEWAKNPVTGSELYRIANVGDAEGHQIFVNESVAWQDLPEPPKG